MTQLSVSIFDVNVPVLTELSGWLRLNDEILACSAWISPTFEEHEVRTLMISKVRRIIKHVERDAEVYAFGSHETKLYLPGG